MLTWEDTEVKAPEATRLDPQVRARVRVRVRVGVRVRVRVRVRLGSGLGLGVYTCSPSASALGAVSVTAWPDRGDVWRYGEMKGDLGEI